MGSLVFFVNRSGTGEIFSGNRKDSDRFVSLKRKTYCLILVGQKTVPDPIVWIDRGKEEDK